MQLLAFAICGGRARMRCALPTKVTIWFGFYVQPYFNALCVLPRHASTNRAKEHAPDGKIDALTQGGHPRRAGQLLRLPSAPRGTVGAEAHGIALLPAAGSTSDAVRHTHSASAREQV